MNKIETYSLELTPDNPNYFADMFNIKNDDEKKITITSKYSLRKKIITFIKTRKWIHGKKYMFDAKINMKDYNSMELLPKNKIEIKEY